MIEPRGSERLEALQQRSLLLCLAVEVTSGEMLSSCHERYTEKQPKLRVHRSRDESPTYLVS